MIKPVLSALAALLLAAGHGQAATPEDPWRVDAAVSYSGLTKGLEPWRDAAAVLTYRPDADLWLSAGYEACERFGLNDTVDTVKVARTFGQGAVASAALALSPEAHFRAASALQLSATSAPVIGDARGWRVAVGLDATISRYRAGDVDSAQPLLILSDRHGFELTTRLIETWDETGRRLTGFAVQAQAPLSKRLQLTLGYADAPESDQGRTVDARTAHAALSLDVSDWTTVRLTAVRAVETAFDRNELTLSLARRF